MLNLRIKDKTSCSNLRYSQNCKNTVEPPNYDITGDRKYISLNRGVVVQRFSRWRTNRRIATFIEV